MNMGQLTLWTKADMSLASLETGKCWMAVGQEAYPRQMQVHTGHINANTVYILL